MGFRYHRSIKILPGVKVNLNKNSHSVTIGGKYAHGTINKKRGTYTQSYRTPIKGLSYSKTYKINDDTYEQPVKQSSPLTYKICGIVALVFGILSALLGLLTITVGGFIILIIAAVLLFFGVAWIKKSKQVRLETNSSTRINTENTVPELTYTQAENCLRILNDCSEILQSTCDPDVFFSRLNLMWEHIQRIQGLSLRITFSPSPDEIEKAFVEDKDEVVYDFLVRYFNETETHAEQLKTEKGKKNCYQKMFDTLSEHLDQLSEENLQYIQCKKQNLETILDIHFN